MKKVYQNFGNCKTILYLLLQATLSHQTKQKWRTKITTKKWKAFIVNALKQEKEELIFLMCGQQEEMTTTSPLQKAANALTTVATTGTNYSCTKKILTNSPKH